MTHSISALLLLILTATAPAISMAAHLVKRAVLDNGLVLLTSEQRTVPTVTFNMVVRAGAKFETEGSEGIANLTSHMLLSGTSNRSALEINEDLDFIGARLRIRCARDLATVTLTVLRKDLDAGLKLLAEIFIDSQFPSDEIQRRKRTAMASIKSKEENPREIARDEFRAALYPRSPYGRRIEGTHDSVATLARNELTAFYNAHYRPNNSILSTVGDFSHGEITEKINLAFKSWRQGPLPAEPMTPKPPDRGQTIRIHKNLTQANIIIGHGGIHRNHPDYYPFHVMNHILGGGGLSSRLANSIRTERGLAYSVSSVANARKVVGTFRVGMQTKNESAQEAIGITVAEIKRIRDQGVTNEELREAKDYLIGSFPLSLDTNRRVARLLSRMEYLELGLDYLHRFGELIERVGPNDIIRAARNHLHPDRLTTVIVANQEKAR